MGEEGSHGPGARRKVCPRYLRDGRRCSFPRQITRAASGVRGTNSNSSRATTRPPALQPVPPACATVALPPCVPLAPGLGDPRRILRFGPLALKDLGEGALLLQVVALRARATQPRLAVDHHAHGPAIGAHGLHRERAVGPARPELHGVERVDGAAAPLDLVAGVGRAPEAALAQHVVLVLAPPHGACHPPSRRRPARGPTCAHARRLHVFTEPGASRPRAHAHESSLAINQRRR